MAKLLQPTILGTFGEDGPTVVPISDIHRAGDGWVRFYHRPDPQAEELVPRASVRVSELAQMFPEFVQFLAQDGYFSINSFYRAGTARTGDLRYLNAAYADLDHHKRGVTPARAVGLILEAVDTELIPMPSVLVRSGNGTWIMYLIGDADAPDRGQRAYREGAEVGLYLAINAELHRRLALHYPDLNPDPAALDASRLCRVPGSLNTKAMRYVRFVYLGDQHGLVPVYTLRELAGLLGVNVARAMYPPRQESATKAPKRRAGWVAAKEAMLAEFQLIRDLRGGFRAGHRNMAALIYGTLLRGLSYTPEEIQTQVAQLGAECRDARGLHPAPLPPDQCRTAARSAIKRGIKFSAAEIAKRLGVTRDEARYLGLEKLTPDYAPATGRHYARKTPQDGVEHRRHTIRLVVEAWGYVPPIDTMRAELAERGLQASHGTVAGDYRALGLRSGWGTQNTGDKPPKLPFDE